MRFAYYPGCAQKGSSRFYDASIRRVLDFFGIELSEIDDWSCCGATAARGVDRDLALLLVARNIGLAETTNLHLFTPCSACFNRMKTTNDMIRKDGDFRNRINNIIHPLRCSGTVEVRNILDIFMAYIGLERIAASVCFDLSRIAVVPYYGCMLTRLHGTRSHDDAEDPSVMDILLKGLGFDVKPWPFKMECCGGSKTLVDSRTTQKLSERIMKRAQMEGAAALVTPCPLCQMNLELLPHMGGSDGVLPVLFISEAFELALFGNLAGGTSHLVPPQRLLSMINRGRRDPVASGDQ